jgi:hypothetical protein
MQTLKSEREDVNARSERFSMRIGSTVFEVHVLFNTGKAESLEDKMLRMMKSDLTGGQFYGKITMPQADRLPERGSA